MIPKLSTPLTKLIRTLEGIIWLGANIALIIAPIVSSHVSPADSIQWGSIMNTVVIVARFGLKGLAIAHGLGLPAQTALLSAGNLTKVEGVAGEIAGDVASDVSKGASVEQVLGQIETASAAAAALQAKPGTPAAQLTSGLSPAAVADAGSAAKPPIDPTAK